MLMGASRIFPRRGQIRSLGTTGDEGPPAGYRNRAPLCVWGEAPRSRRQVWKWCINNSSTKRFAATTKAQKTLQYFQRGGGKCPSCSCLRAHTDVIIRQYGCWWLRDYQAERRCWWKDPDNSLNIFLHTCPPGFHQLNVKNSLKVH